MSPSYQNVDYSLFSVDDGSGCGCSQSRESSEVKERWGDSYDPDRRKEDGPHVDEMVYIESGTFFMGTNDPVCIGKLFIYKYFNIKNFFG